MILDTSPFTSPKYGENTTDTTTRMKSNVLKLPSLMSRKYTQGRDPHAQMRKMASHRKTCEWFSDSWTSEDTKKTRHRNTQDVMVVPSGRHAYMTMLLF